VTGRSGGDDTWPVVLRRILTERKSTNRFSEAAVEVKIWQRELPSVDAVRPGRCPGCGNAGAPAGGRVGLVGHGLRSRDVRGPAEVSGEPVEGTVVLRRYRCRSCTAVVTVGPRGLVHRRLYTAPAIALALMLWSCEDVSAPAVRRRISPLRRMGDAAASGWASLRRWAQAATGGSMWPGLAARTEPTLRRCSARVVGLVAARTVPVGSLPARVFAGAHLLR